MSILIYLYRYTCTTINTPSQPFSPCPGSMGDLIFKDSGVTAEPEIVHWSSVNVETYLVICSDGRLVTVAMANDGPNPWENPRKTMGKCCFMGHEWDIRCFWVNLITTSRRDRNPADDSQSGKSFPNGRTIQVREL